MIRRKFEIKVFIITILMLFITPQVKSQLEAGAKVGASTIKYANPDFQSIILMNRNIDEYELSIDDLSFGYHFGLYSRLTVWKLFLQLETVLNSYSATYQLEDLQNGSPIQLLKEQYTSVDVPLVLGVKLGWFNLQGGLSGNIPIASISELKNIEGYNPDPTSFNYSYLGGFGIDIWRLRFDFRYELSTTFFGDHITFRGEEYQFSDKDNRFIAGLAYKF